MLQLFFTLPLSSFTFRFTRSTHNIQLYRVEQAQLVGGHLWLFFDDNGGELAFYQSSGNDRARRLVATRYVGQLGIVATRQSHHYTLGFVFLLLFHYPLGKV